MSFDATETSTFEGKPQECYRFSWLGNTYNATSADRTVLLPVGTFEPDVIHSEGQDFSPEDTGETLIVTVPRDNRVAALFVGEIPSTQILMTKYVLHRGEETLFIVPFTGTVKRCRWKGSEAELIVSSLLSALNREVPSVGVQTPCNHTVYSAECGANPSTSVDAVTITSVDGLEVVSADFAVRADQWFRGGRLEDVGGATRFIGDHVGDTITLMSKLPGLQSADSALAFWGCDHLEPTCDTKFGVLERHAGFARLSLENPFDGRID